MPYVDGYALPIPKRNLKAYLKMARLGQRLWMKHGALDYCESIADDLGAAWCRPFSDAAGAKKGETVVFAYVVFKSRAHRDRVNAKVMADMGNFPQPKTMPFDCKRMVYGGFKVAVGGRGAKRTRR